MKHSLFMALLLLATPVGATPIDCGNADNTFTPSSQLCGGNVKLLDDWFRTTYGDAYTDSLADYMPSDLGELGSRLWLYGFERGYYAELTGTQWEGRTHPVPEPSSFILMAGGALALMWVRRRPRS